MTIHSSSKNWDADVRRAAQEVDAKFRRRDWTSTYPGHGEGSAKGAYAVDYMCGRVIGFLIASYVWKNRKRLGVRYVIWWGRIISETSSSPNRWVRYFNADNPNPSKSHKNHVHCSHYQSFTYAPPKGSGLPKPPVNGPRVSLKGTKAALLASVVPPAADDFREFQRSLNSFHNGYYVLKADGVPGKDTRRSTALAQLTVAKANGSSLGKTDCWPDKGHHADLNGIPGPELFARMGIRNTDVEKGLL